MNEFLRNKKVLVIGASGLVGNALYEEFSHDVDTIGTYYTLQDSRFTFLDMQNKRSVEECLNNTEPDIVLLPAASPNVDYCESNPEETWKINVEGALNVLDTANNIGAQSVFFSTDYVFDGENGPYQENADVNPLNEYGRQKLAVEEYIEKYIPFHIIIRITVVYGWELRGKNFVTRLLQKLREGEEVLVPNDQIGTPTHVKTISKGVKELLSKNERGIYHIAGPDVVPRSDFAKSVAQTWGYDTKLIKPVPTNELNSLAPRPMKAGLLATKAKEVLQDTPFYSISNGLLEMKETQKK